MQEKNIFIVPGNGGGAELEQPPWHAVLWEKVKSEDSLMLMRLYTQDAEDVPWTPNDY